MSMKHNEEAITKQGAVFQWSNRQEERSHISFCYKCKELGYFIIECLKFGEREIQED